MKLSYLIIFIFLTGNLQSQSATFYRNFSLPTSIYPGDISVEVNQQYSNIYSSAWSGNSSTFINFELILDPSGEIENNIGIKANSSPTFQGLQFQSFRDPDNNLFAISHDLDSISIAKLNPANNLLWTKDVVFAANTLFYYRFAALSDQGGGIQLFGANYGKIAYCHINSDGLISSIQNLRPWWSDWMAYSISFNDVLKKNAKVISIGTAKNSLTNTTGGFIIEMDENLENQRFFSIEGVAFSDIISKSTNEFFIVGEKDTPENRNPVLIHMNTEYEILNAYEFIINDSLFLPKFPTAVINDSGDIFFAFNLFTNSAILKINSELNLVWAKIFPSRYFDPKKNLAVTDDDRLLFGATTLNDDLSSSLDVYKMTFDGEILGFTPAEFCDVEIQPFNPAVTEYGYTISENGSYSTGNSDFCEFEFEVSEINNFTYPSPFFNLPDTICIDNCTSPTLLENENAHLTEWTFENADTETSQNPDPGQICFSEPGTHRVSQTITFHNCTETYETTITVLPDIDIDLGADQTLCPDTQINLIANETNADNFLWNNGSQASSLSVQEAGLYILEASNAACSDTDSVLIAPFTPLESFFLPPDTSLCPEYLPLELSPNIGQGENIRWQDGSETETFLVYEPGVYTAQVDFEGCTYTAQTHIDIEDCSAKIFLPNIFSPNLDGVNDLFFPQGENFRTEEFTIYDRWGNLIFQASEDAFAWDGTQEGTPLDPGVYVYVLRWEALLTEKSGVKFGEVTLVR